MEKIKCKSSPDKKHHRGRSCTCSVIALEPNDNCRVHGYSYGQDQCIYCGQFMKMNKEKGEAS